MWYRRAQKISKPINKRYYTATPHRFGVGDIISPTYEKKNFNASEAWGRGIWMTNSPAPHFTVLTRSMDEGWHVYEVAPHGKVRLGDWDDYYTDSPVRVVRYVGPARGMAKRKKPLTDAEKSMIEQIKEEIEEEKAGDADPVIIKYLQEQIDKIIYRASHVWTKRTDQGRILK